MALNSMNSRPCSARTALPTSCCQAD